MDKKQALQVLELPDRIVTVVHGLLALEPIDSEADVRLLIIVTSLAPSPMAGSEASLPFVTASCAQTDNLALWSGDTRAATTLLHIFASARNSFPIAWSLIAVRK